jgi:hypothetical protein
MACFSDTPYANWSYQLLITLNNAVVEGEGPVSLGCYAAMNSSEQAYQFYKVLNQLANNAEFLTQNCFVQLTDAQQWEALNDAIADALAPTPEPEPEPRNRNPNRNRNQNRNPKSNYR